MTLIYVAGSMTGISEHNYPAFDAAASALESLGYDVNNPASIDAIHGTDAAQTWAWYMRHAIRLLLTAQAVALLPGWEDSRGARLEHRIATDLMLDIRPLDTWLASPSILTAARLTATSSVHRP